MPLDPRTAMAFANQARQDAINALIRRATNQFYEHQAGRLTGPEWDAVIAANRAEALRLEIRLLALMMGNALTLIAAPLHCEPIPLARVPTADERELLKAIDGILGPLNS